jgi:hypothetical protein
VAHVTRTKKRKSAKPCKGCNGLGAIFPRFLWDAESPTESLLRHGVWVPGMSGEQRATIERCDECRKYPNDHAASAAIEGKARLYDEIMAVRETPAKKKKEDT